MRIVTVTGDPLTRISRGSSTTSVSARSSVPPVVTRLMRRRAVTRPMNSCLLEPDDDRFRRRCIRLGGNVIQRNEGIGFGIVGGGVASRSRVGDDEEVLDAAFFNAAVGVGKPDTRSTRSPAANPNASMSAGLTKITRRPPLTPR